MTKEKLFKKHIIMSSILFVVTAIMGGIGCWKIFSFGLAAFLPATFIFTIFIIGFTLSIYANVKSLVNMLNQKEYDYNELKRIYDVLSKKLNSY